MYFLHITLSLNLQRCIQCNNNAPNCETMGLDGPGVNNTDYILYVGTNPGGSCFFGGVLAFANLCQMESTLDRWGWASSFVLTSNSYNYSRYAGNTVVYALNSMRQSQMPLRTLQVLLFPNSTVNHVIIITNSVNYFNCVYSGTSEIRTPRDLTKASLFRRCP